VFSFCGRISIILSNEEYEFYQAVAATLYQQRSEMGWLKRIAVAIPIVNEFNFLGLVIDEKLILIPHIKYLKNLWLKAMNLCLGALRASYIAILQVEANKLPLNLRR
jgi:hypothetical protein